MNKIGPGCSRMGLILNAAFSWVVKLREDPELYLIYNQGFIQAQNAFLQIGKPSMADPF